MFYAKDAGQVESNWIMRLKQIITANQINISSHHMM